ncbi:DUF1490 family protein [Pseudonocardia spinosispora]|uniref:DUF1490 family protein n=1 Tax=Pseudonocardia spinosispora TaxID=103441 RepID=UPI00048C9C75|nr:DUF1490 family protein [Pseudonocardia spinosispora]
MSVGDLAARTAGLIVTGLTGAAAYDGLKRLARGRTVRTIAVSATAAGLRGVRAAEVGAERARLTAADIVSEARERIGEQSPPPGATTNSHTHDH